MVSPETLFVVNQQGEVFEKDLGPETSAITRAMTMYNPDRTWAMTRQKLAGKPVKAEKQALSRDNLTSLNFYGNVVTTAFVCPR
ncbi:MAG: DUF2950 family protein [Candidatus Xenobiia bacterium LiM19]